MSTPAVERVFPKALLAWFVELARREVGPEKLRLVLTEVQLSPAMLEEASLASVDASGAADLYARLQQALRLFYGRGARGSLIRIGHGLWERIAAGTSFLERAELRVLRSLPAPARPRRALEVVASRLREGGGTVSIHCLDMDLMLADHSSAATLGQSSSVPICFVMQGLIQGALAWALGREIDVEEISCRAMGQPACEFRIFLGDR